MDSEHVNMCFIPLSDNPMNHQRLDRPSDGSMHSSLSTTPHVSEFALQQHPTSPQSRYTTMHSPSSSIPISPDDVVLMDEMWQPSRRDSSYSFPQSTDKTQTTSRRRAQNRVAQRAFRERQQQRTRELDEQLSSVTEKYKALENDYRQLKEAYSKLEQTLELLACEDEGMPSGDPLRRFLEIIQGKARPRVKTKV